MGDAMATDVSVTFKVSEDMARWISQAAFNIDKNKSEINKSLYFVVHGYGHQLPQFGASYAI